MKSAVAARNEATIDFRTKFADYLELTKPRIAVLVLFTVAAGFLLASRGTVDIVLMMHTLLATALIAAGSSALNQYLERETDQHMHRTENRPLPTGRMSSVESVCFGIALGVAGLVYMSLVVRQPLAVIIAAVTFLLYVWVYTPLKKVTTMNTLVGAVPGALPPLIGWAAASSTISADGWALFFLLFLWQIPHFLGIAWIYREDYARAGLRMLPVVDPTGRATGRQMILYTLALIAVSASPFLTGAVGITYLLCVMTTGLYFLITTIQFARQPSKVTAKGVVRASILYLPVLLLVLVLCSYF